MAIPPVSSGSAEPAATPPDSGSWTVQPGETLSGIARQLQREGVPGSTAELVRTLARLNGLTDPDRIEVGQVLRVPGAFAPLRAERDVIGMLERGVARAAGTLRMHLDEQRTRLETALLRWVQPVRDEPAPSRGTGSTPLFRQADPAWRGERLGLSGDGPTLAQAGCAVTACAMALSQLGGTVVTPDALVRHLRGSNGFRGPLLDWSVAGSAIPGGTRASPAELDCERIDRELDRGRPVLLRVVHGVQGQARQHWICLTGRDPASGRYTANDPATGRTTVLAREGPALASLAGEPVAYASDGRMVTFRAAPGAET